MEKWSIWKLIKTGFWLGIGFIIPQLVVAYLGTAITILAMPSMMESTFESRTSETLSDLASSFDVSDQIEIEHYRVTNNVKQVLVLGSIMNTGTRKASSIQLEAELTDKDGNFVFECSEYISNDLKPGARENFQIKCGCGNNPVPDYSKVEVRVVNAMAY